MSRRSIPTWPVIWLPFDPAQLRLTDARAESANSSVAKTRSVKFPKRPKPKAVKPTAGRGY